MLQFSPGQVGAGWRTHLPSLRAGGRAEKGRGPWHGMCPVNASPASAAPAFSGGLKGLQCARVSLRRAIQRALSRTVFLVKLEYENYFKYVQYEQYAKYAEKCKICQICLTIGYWIQGVSNTGFKGVCPVVLEYNNM